MTTSNFINFSILCLVILLTITGLITFGYGLGDQIILIIIIIPTVIFSFLIHYLEKGIPYYIISSLLLLFTIVTLIFLIFCRGVESPLLF